MPKAGGTGTRSSVRAAEKAALEAEQAAAVVDAETTAKEAQAEAAAAAEELAAYRVQVESAAEEAQHILDERGPGVDGERDEFSGLSVGGEQGTRALEPAAAGDWRPGRCGAAEYRAQPDAC